MSTSAPRSLGILNLERGLPPGVPTVDPRPGHLLNPDTFDFPVISETVAGAWADNVLRGDRSLGPAYVAAAQRLVERGAVAISANCGFSVRHHAEVAEAVQVPVALSSLMLLPVPLRQIPALAKVGLITADSKCLEEDVIGVPNEADRKRIVVGGVEGGTLWQNEMKRPPPRTEVSAINADVMACVTRLKKSDDGIAALLFECTAFPTVAASVRRETGLPVYDITTLCRMLYGAAS